jgi:hypothetical protein
VAKLMAELVAELVPNKDYRVHTKDRLVYLELEIEWG